MKANKQKNKVRNEASKGRKLTYESLKFRLNDKVHTWTHTQKHTHTHMPICTHTYTHTNVWAWHIHTFCLRTTVVPWYPDYGYQVKLDICTLKIQISSVQILKHKKWILKQSKCINIRIFWFYIRILLLDFKAYVQMLQYPYLYTIISRSWSIWIVESWFLMFRYPYIQIPGYLGIYSMSYTHVCTHTQVGVQGSIL